LVSEVPLGNLQFAGVAIAQMDPGWYHAGMLHREDDGPVVMLDLGWDHFLRNEPPDQKYAWVQLKLHALRLRSVAAMCRRIARVYARPEPGLPYAFRYKDAVFGDDGRLVLGDSEHGLTCATFVIAVLKSVSVELLNLTEWPHRRQDEERHRQLLARLDEDPRVSRAHVAAVSDEVQCVRYRPEEVVGASASMQMPVPFCLAETAGEHIVRVLELRSAPPPANPPSATPEPT
jgi:hypothetical protein